jgi:hypothetical protein
MSTTIEDSRYGSGNGDVKTGYVLCLESHEASANCSSKAKSHLPSIFVNSAFVELSHIHSLSYCLWLLFYSSRMRRCNRDHITHKIKNIFCLILCNKNLSTLVVDKHVLHFNPVQLKLEKEQRQLEERNLVI